GLRGGLLRKGDSTAPRRGSDARDGVALADSNGGIAVARRPHPDGARGCHFGRARRTGAKVVRQGAARVVSARVAACPSLSWCHDGATWCHDGAKSCRRLWWHHLQTRTAARNRLPIWQPHPSSGSPSLDGSDGRRRRLKSTAMSAATDISDRLRAAVNRQRLVDTAVQLVAVPSRT